MKTKLLLFIIVITALFKVPLLFAQDVFPKSDVIWIIHTYGNEPPAQYIYGLSGDTIVNDLTYQKLYLLNDSTLNINHEDVYVAGIRQIDKQVRILPADKKDGSKFEEFLMYDFGKEIGEEINFGKKPPMGYDNWKPTFENVDINFLRDMTGYIDYTRNSEYGTIYLINGDIMEEWIEGIGNLSGLFFFPFTYTLGGSFMGGELICMKQQNEIKYKSINCTSCFDTPFRNANGIDDISDDNNLSVYYDKKQASIIIESKNISSLIFNLYKLDGISVYSSTISNVNTYINTSSTPKGMYFYSLTGSNFAQSGKLIIK